MTIAVDWDIKQQTKLNASIYEILVLVSLASSQGSDESVLSCSFTSLCCSHTQNMENARGSDMGDPEISTGGPGSTVAQWLSARLET